MLCDFVTRPFYCFLALTPRAGNATTPGACTDKWPSGLVWKYEAGHSPNFCEESSAKQRYHGRHLDLGILCLHYTRSYSEPQNLQHHWESRLILFIWTSQGNISSANDTCTGVYGDVTGIECGPQHHVMEKLSILVQTSRPLCWRCSPPRYVFDVKFAGAAWLFLVTLHQMDG